MIDHLDRRWAALGARALHRDRLWRAWLHAQPLHSGPTRAETFYPRALLDDIDRLAADLAALARVASAHAGADGAEKLLLRLHDGLSVESVLLPRGGLCISTQVGCAVGCVFCMTGRDGLQRQLGSTEMAAQLALARTRRPVRKVVLMGMGEPAHNLDNVLAAIDLFGTCGGLGHKNIVFSTVGDRRAFERLPEGRVKPALALSLHSTDATTRARLLPRAPRIDPDELVGLALAYAQSTGYPLQVQWTLLDGVNDGPDEVDGLVRLLAGRSAVLNLIPYNAVDGTGFRRPAAERAAAMARTLHARGVLTKLRRSAGQDVDAGCGQLRARALDASSGGPRNAPLPASQQIAWHRAGPRPPAQPPVAVDAR